jgi:O-antigen/teichoic acid export membrane protein
MGGGGPPADGSDVEGEVQGLARASSFSLIGLLVNAALTFLFMLMVSRSLTQLAAGAVFVAIAIFTTTSMISTAGANIGLMRSLPKYRRRSVEDVRRSVLVAFLPTLVIGVTIAAILFFKAPWIAHYLVRKVALRPEAISQLRVLAPTIPAAAIVYVLLWGDRAWGIKASVSIQYIFVPFLRIALFLGFAAVGITAVRATSAWGVPFYVAFLVTLVITYRRLRQRSAMVPGVEPNPHPLSYREHASTFWRFAAPRSIEGILLAVLSSLDIILVGALASPKLAAVYTIANRYSLLCAFGLQAMIVAIPTRISDLMHTGRKVEAREVYRVATWWTIGMCWPPAFALSIYAPTFMGLFGHQYRSGAPSLIILSIGILVTSATGPGGAVLLMSGKSSANLLCTAIAVGLNVPLNIVLIPHLGSSGAAIAWSASILVTNSVQMLMLWFMFGIHPFGRELLIITGTCVGVFVGLGFVGRLLLGDNIVSLAIYTVISCAVYAAVVYRSRTTLRLDSFTTMVKGAVT